MFRKRNAHADPHSLMSELLETIHECLASAEVGAVQTAEAAKGATTAVAFQQSEPAPASPGEGPGPHDDAQ